MLELLTNLDLYAPAHVGTAHLLVAAGRIVAITSEVPDTGDLDVTVTDLGGRRVIPGLVDGHVHVTGGGGEDGPKTRVPPLPLTAYTTAGVTTVIGLLGTDDTTRSTAELIARVHGLRQEGLSAWALTGGYHLPAETLTGSVRGDIAQIEAIVGIGEVAISDHRSSQLTLEELLKLGADVHVGALLGGKAGVVHLHVGDGERGLDLVRRALTDSELPARTWHPTHVNRRAALLKEAFALVEHGVTIDVTAFPVDDDDPATSASDAIAAYLDVGLPIDHLTVSSDAGGSLPVFDDQGRVTALDTGSPAHLLRTMSEVVANGTDLATVLPVFTSNPARVFGLSRKGRLEVGADADLVVLDDDGTPSDVLATGTWHVRSGAPVVHGTFESPNP